MIAWFTSLKAAIALSVIAMLAFIGYTLLESRYVLEQLTPGIPLAAAETMFVLVLVGGWQWALFAAAGGRRRGLIAALAFSVLAALITLYDLVFYSPIPFGWPLLEITVWITFASCVIAIAAIALPLRQNTGQVNQSPHRR